MRLDELVAGIEAPAWAEVEHRVVSRRRRRQVTGAVGALVLVALVGVGLLVGRSTPPDVLLDGAAPRAVLDVRRSARRAARSSPESPSGW